MWVMILKQSYIVIFYLSTAHLSMPFMWVMILKLVGVNVEAGIMSAIFQCPLCG